MRICLTIDIDWAPDFVIAWMADRVRKAGVPATWFATHDSPVLRDLAADRLQEVGIHPNFFSGSTQGREMMEIVDRLLALYPNARGARAHALLDSTRHQLYYAKRGLRYVSNVLMWGRPSIPFFQPWTGLWQLPITWEDDVACGAAGPDPLRLPSLAGTAVSVLNFHPLYCYLNDSSGMPAYAALKERCAVLVEASPAFVDPLRRTGDGLERPLASVLRMGAGGSFMTMSELCTAAAEKMPRGSR